MNLYLPSNMRTPPPISAPVAPFDAEVHFWKPEPVHAEPAEPEPDTPKEIAPPARDLAAEARKLCQPLTQYLIEFSVAEEVDQFEEGYRNPLSTKPPESALSRSSEAVLGFEAERQQLLTQLEGFYPETHRIPDFAPRVVGR